MPGDVIKEFFGKYVYIETTGKVAVKGQLGDLKLYYAGKLMGCDTNYVKLRPCIRDVGNLIAMNDLFAELTKQEQNGSKTRLITHTSILTIEELVK